MNICSYHEIVHLERDCIACEQSKDNETLRDRIEELEFDNASMVEQIEGLEAELREFIST